VIDFRNARTPDFMLQLKRELGKEITSRTWNTVRKVTELCAD
jgi:hypothetical protein